MAPLLPVKKIYVDSQFMSADSVSGSNFIFELPFSITLPKECIFLIDDVCIPHTWYSIETNINDKLYIYLSYAAPASGTPISLIVQLPAGNYNGTLFQAELQSLLNAQLPGIFTVTYNATTSNVTIAATSAPTGCNFQILTDNDLSTSLNGLFTQSFNKSNPASINDILRNYGTAPKYSTSNPYTSGFLNFSPINNLYLSSPNLGTFTTLAPRGSMNVIKKIPVSADFGYMIIDRVVSTHDYLECGAQNLRSLEFNLRDGKGNYIQLHGENISFSVVFSTQMEDR